MNENEYVNGTSVNQYELIKLPEFSDWECYLFGGGDGFSFGLKWNPIKGHVPNFFWRWMQYLCFGHRWRKIKK